MRGTAVRVDSPDADDDSHSSCLCVLKDATFPV